jgi:hypothetical protein
MMELATPALSSEAPIIRPLSIGDNGPIMISMSHEEYTSRTSRETILQRLSEALMRHSLAKVRNGVDIRGTRKCFALYSVSLATGMQEAPDAAKVGE